MGRKRKSRSLRGLTRVYWKDGQWQYRTSDSEKAITGRTWVKLGTNDRQAVKTHAGFLESVGRPTGEMNYLFDEYLIECRATLKETTVKAKIQEMKLLRKTFGLMNAADILPQHVSQYYSARWKQSPTQANHELSTLSAALSFGVATLGLLPTNPCREVKRRTVASRDRLPTLPEIDAVKRHGSEWVKGVLDFIYITGCVRRTDICQLKRSHFDDDGFHPQTSKTGKKGFVPWTPELRTAVERMQSLNPKFITSTTHLVLGRNGNPLSVSAYNKRLAIAMKRAIKAGDLSEGFNAHDVRATHAETSKRLGLNPTDQLLHGDSKTTKAYLRSKSETKIQPLTPRDGGSEK